MARCIYCGKTHNIGFVSTHFSGTDGISVETEKWASFFEKEGFSCYYFAGKLDRQTRDIIKNPENRRKMVDHNYKIASRYYSYATLHKKLKNLILEFSCVV